MSIKNETKVNSVSFFDIISTRIIQKEIKMEPNNMQPIRQVSQLQSVSLSQTQPEEFQPQNLKNENEVNPKIALIAIAIFASVILGLIIAIIVVLVIRGGITMARTVPTPELAISVCEKYGGTLDESDSDDSNYNNKTYYCNRSDGDIMFIYEMSFIDKKQLDESRSKIKSLLMGYTILENRDDFIKAYAKQYSYHGYVFLYENVYARIVSTDQDFLNILSVELGFPDSDNALINNDKKDESGYYPTAITAKVAEEVCEKYDGKIVNEGESRFGVNLDPEGLLDVKICERYTYYEVDPELYRDSSYRMDGTPMTDQEIQDAYGVTILPTDFSYTIGFLEDDKKDEYRNDLRNKIVNFERSEDISKYTMLEDSDEVIKACRSIAGLTLECIGMYDNAVMGVFGGDYSTIDKVFANLGFPDRNRLEDYAQAKRSTEGSEFLDLKH